MAFVLTAKLHNQLNLTQFLHVLFERDGFLTSEIGRTLGRTNYYPVFENMDFLFLKSDNHQIQIHCMLK